MPAEIVDFVFFLLISRKYCRTNDQTMEQKRWGPGWQRRSKKPGPW